MFFCPADNERGKTPVETCPGVPLVAPHWLGGVRSFTPSLQGKVYAETDTEQLIRKLSSVPIVERLSWQDFLSAERPETLRSATTYRDLPQRTRHDGERNRNPNEEEIGEP